MQTCIIKFGGSFLIPDVSYDWSAIDSLANIIKSNPEKQFVIIVGGGGLARTCISNANISAVPNTLLSVAKDELGIAATKINAAVVREVLSKTLGKNQVQQEIILDATRPPTLSKRVIFAAGSSPGHTTDFDMMQLAIRYDAVKAIKVSNVSHILDVHPKDWVKGNSYPIIEKLTWSQFQSLVGDVYWPGGHFPLDPLALKLRAQLSPAFMLILGTLDQLPAMVSGENFIGSIVQD